MPAEEEEENEKAGLARSLGLIQLVRLWVIRGMDGQVGEEKMRHRPTESPQSVAGNMHGLSASTHSPMPMSRTRARARARG